MSEAGHHDNPLAQLESPVIHIPGIPEIYSMFLITTIIFLLLAVWARVSLKRKTKFAYLFEMAVEWIRSQAVSIIGHEGEKFVSFFCTLFLFIFFSNLIGLVPGFKSPTSSLNTNFALALIIFFMTHYLGIRKKGAWGYLKHFLGPPYWMAPLMLPIHLIGELVRPLTLTLRLFGNINAKEILLGSLVFIFTVLYHSPGVTEKILMVFPVLLRPAIILLGVIIGAVQALVFTMLSMAYFAGAMATEEH